MRLKKLTALVMILSIILGNSVVYGANDKPTDNKKDEEKKVVKYETKIIRKDFKDKKSLDKHMKDFSIKEEELGVEKTLQSYEDGSSLVVVVEEGISEQAKSLSASAEVESRTVVEKKIKERTFKYYKKTLFGKRLVYKIEIETTYYSGGVYGGIIEMWGGITTYDSAYSVHWDDDYTSTEPYIFSLGVHVAHTSGSADIIYISAYNPNDGTLTIRDY